MKKRLFSCRAEIETLAAMAAIVLAVLAFGGLGDGAFQMFTANGITYPTATVDKVLSEDLQAEEGTGRYLGSQTLLVTLHGGKRDGEQVEVVNNIAADHNVLARVGGRVVVKAENQEGLEPFYSVFNYDRAPGITALVVVFAACMALVGGTKGVRSLLGLAFALFMVVAFLLPAIYGGASPIAMGLVTAVAVTVSSMVLLNGWSAKTGAAIASTTLGLGAAVAVYLVFSALLHVSGYNQEGAEELIIIQQGTGLDVYGTLFTGVLIASLGAVMDMCMSIATSLFEIRAMHTEMPVRGLVVSGFAIGRDMIGTMCQTLILAFTGSSLTSLLVLISYGVDVNQLLSSDYMAIELLHSFVGGIAVVLCVPITAAVCALAAGRGARGEAGA